MTALVFDTETTGRHNPQIIEAAWIELDAPSSLQIKTSFEQRYKPSQAIELGALAVHHILDEELQDCPSCNSFSLPDHAEYLIGHNIDYDWAVAGKPELKRICTLALSRYFYPELDSHTQSAMLYFLYRSQAKTWLKQAHSALADVQNCLKLLENLIQKADSVDSWEDLWQLSEQARLPHVMPFGKHKGMLIEQVPNDYKAWLLKQDNVDPYLIKALKQFL